MFSFIPDFYFIISLQKLQLLVLQFYSTKTIMFHHNMLMTPSVFLSLLNPMTSALLLFNILSPLDTLYLQGLQLWILSDHNAFLSFQQIHACSSSVCANIPEMLVYA